MEYTGASLFVSSNGLITFGYGIADFTNTDLSSWPDAPAIAPLWDDWVTFADEADEVLGKFDDEDGNGTADRLVIEWTVLHYGTYNSHVTFQALLGLNAGGLADPIIFNYPDLDTGDGDAEGQTPPSASRTTAQGPNRLLVSANSASPFVGTGQALRIAVEPEGPGLYVSNASVAEGNDGTVEAVFRVTLVNPPEDQTVTVNYATADGSATAPGDYTSQSGPLSFPPGTTSREVRVVVNGDRVDEANETFLVNLSNANGATIVDGQGGGSILDDDTAGITVSPASGLVTSESGTSASLSVVLTSQPTANVTITLASSDTTEGTVSPAMLVFTSANWNTAQLASVTGVNDAAGGWKHLVRRVRIRGQHGPQL